MQELVDEIKAAIEALRTAMTSENPDEIKSKNEELQKAIMKIGTELSKKAGGDGGDASGDAAQEPEVKEAEYEEPKNNDKK